MELFETVITSSAKYNVLECLSSERLSEGDRVRKFEQEIERQFGYKNCIAVNSGTSALHLALILAGVKAGDEVIIPAQTFVATGMAVLYCGAKVVFADIERETGNISFEDVRRKMTDKTKAVIAVAWGGNPVLENFTGCKTILDYAQALGAPPTNYDFACLSFQATKQLTTGDGGMVACKNKADEVRGRRLRWFGIDREFDLPNQTGERQYMLSEIGYKYHMNDLSAALGLGNLEGFSSRQEIRTRIADYYTDNLPEEVLTHRSVYSANWLYTILVNDRPAVLRRFEKAKIPASVVHVGIDKHKVFGGFQDLPNQRYWDIHHLCIPINSRMTLEDAEKVVKIIKDE